MRKGFKFLAVAAVTAVTAITMFVALPAKALAQTDTDSTYEWDSSDWDWESSDYDYDSDWSDAAEFNYTYSDELTAEEEAAVVTAVLAMVGVMLVPALIVGLAVYVYVAIALMKIGEKVGVEDSKKWMAWVPIANLFYMAECAGLEWWHGLIAVFIPFWPVYLMMKMAEKRGFSKWTGCLVLVPIANLIFIGYLAWGEPKPAA